MYAVAVCAQHNTSSLHFFDCASKRSASQQPVDFLVVWFFDYVVKVEGCGVVLAALGAGKGCFVFCPGLFVEIFTRSGAFFIRLFVLLVVLFSVLFIVFFVAFTGSFLALPFFF